MFWHAFCIPLSAHIPAISRSGTYQLLQIPRAGLHIPVGVAETLCKVLNINLTRASCQIAGLRLRLLSLRISSPRGTCPIAGRRLLSLRISSPRGTCPIAGLRLLSLRLRLSGRLDGGGGTTTELLLLALFRGCGGMAYETADGVADAATDGDTCSGGSHLAKQARALLGGSGGLQDRGGWRGSGTRGDRGLGGRARLRGGRGARGRASGGASGDVSGGSSGRPSGRVSGTTTACHFAVVSSERILCW